MSVELPFRENASVAESKITGYLFKWFPKDDKSGFMVSWGFSVERPDEVRSAPIRHAETNPVTSTRLTKTGVSYELVGPLETPTGTKPSVLTVRHIATGETEPRFVTLRPQMEG